jgi:hypothetical protein
MALKTLIDLPAPTRAAGGLLSAARPLPGGWERGVLFNGSTCLGPETWPFCPPEASPPPDTKLYGVLGDVAEFEPFGIYQGIECTNFSANRAATAAAEALDVTAEYQLGSELATGTATGNPSLGDATPLSAAGDPTEGLAIAEAAAAEDLYGRLAFIHVSPKMLTMLVGAQVVYREGRSWRSPNGHIVVASPGYGVLADLIHVTAEVFASLGVPETMVDIDRAINQNFAQAEQIGLAAFDPCFNVSVEVQ